MNAAGVSPRLLLQLAREAREGGRPAGPVLVVGPLAAHLARSLAEGGDPALVTTAGAAERASVVVCVLGGAPKPEQLALLRAAARAGVPSVAVQTGEPAHVPYVLPEDVVACTPGKGFPVPEIAAAVARGLGRDAAAVARRLPVLRPAAERRLTLRAAGVAAGVAAAPWGSAAHLPVLVPLQARLLRDLAVAEGRPLPSSQQEVGVSVGPELGAALAVGLAARGLVRRLPLRGPLVRGAVAAGVTLGLASAARLRP
jgi:uncharacterized protein (DUF697 family)